MSGAPGFLSENINPSRGLSNGTPIIFHSLVLDPKENFENIREMLENNDNQDIKLEFPPSFIKVCIPGVDPNDFIG